MESLSSTDTTVDIFKNNRIKYYQLKLSEGENIEEADSKKKIELVIETNPKILDKNQYI